MLSSDALSVNHVVVVDGLVSPPNSYSKNLTPNMTTFGDEAFKW